MAVLPSIASTAKRGILPSERVNVSGATPDAFGASAAQALGGLGNALQGVSQDAFRIAAKRQAEIDRAAALKQERDDKLADIGRQTDFIKFSSDQETGLATALENIEGDGRGLTKNYAAELDTRIAEALEFESPDKLPEQEMRYAQLRANLVGKAMGAEIRHGKDWSTLQTNDGLNRLTNSTAQNPDNFDTDLGQGRRLIESGLTSPLEKEADLQKFDRNLRVSRSTALMNRDPRAFLRSVGVPDHMTVDEVLGRVPNSAGAGEKRRVEHGKIKIDGPGTPVKDGAAAVRSVYPNAQITSNARNPNSALGRANPGSYHNSTRAAIDVAPIAGMTFDQYAQGFRAKGFAVIEAREETGAGRSKHATGDHWHIVLGEPGSGGPPVAQTQADGTLVLPQERTIDKIHEGVDISTLDQLAEKAQSRIDHEQQVQVQVQQEQAGAKVDQLKVGAIDGTLTRAGLAAARANGTLTRPEDISYIENQLDAHDKERKDNAQANAIFAPGGQANPFSDGDRDAVDARFKVMGGTLEAMQAVVARTGIVPKSGATQLRGMMVSMDPQTVAKGSAVAVNLLARNPNAFAGVEGREEIEKAAAIFRGRIGSGATAEQAAAVVTNYRNPANPRRALAGTPEYAGFAKSMNTADVTDDISKWLVNSKSSFAQSYIPFVDKPVFPSEAAKIEAGQLYRSAALEHYAEFGDADGAKAYARDQTLKAYSVEDGVISRYAPSRAYRAVGGSHAYVEKQALEAATAVLGSKPASVRVVPILGETADAIRSGKPAPYAVQYTRIVDGYEVQETLQGKRFYADVAQAIREDDAAKREAARHDVLHPPDNPWRKSQGGL